MSSFFVSEEKTQSILVLIIDKIGIFAKDLAQKIDQSVTTVLVTKKGEKLHENIILIPFDKAIPEIPDGDYTHVIFIWDGQKESLHILSPLLQKAKSDKAQFLFITDKLFYSEKIIDFVHQEYSKASVVLIGDVFGNTQYESVATRLFTQALTGKLQLENVGLKHIYPVLYEDIVEETIKLCFGINRGKVFLAFKQHGMTQLAFAHSLQKIDPFLKIDFKKEETESIPIPGGEYLFPSSYGAEHKLQDAYTNLKAVNHNHEKNPPNMFFSPVAVSEEKKIEKKRKKKWKLAIFLITLLIFSPILFTLLYSVLGSIMLYASQDSIKRQDFQSSLNFSKASKNLFSIGLSANSISQKEIEIDALTRYIRKGNLLASILEDAASAGLSFSKVAKGSSIAPQADFLSGVNAVKDGLVLLEDPNAQLSSLRQISNVLDVSPMLFGFPNKKTYMILFQNNMELRPGGGFIGSYGLVTFDKGRITDFSIHDVYDADGELKGHIEPPYIIRRYIPQQHWYLRDSNFDVDFSQDAANAAFFLSQETGQTVDGVIGVDLTFVKNLLETTGPVYVPEYKETVTSKNLFLLTETHAEKNSFAGSTQKKDFLSALFQAEQKKLISPGNISINSMMPILSSIQSKDILFGFSNSLVQDVFSVNGLSSTLWDGRKNDPNTLNDITGINEANIGVNKANYFVSRKVNQEMSIDNNGNVSGKLTIYFKNISPKNQWPGGSYKNYLRIILPQGSILSSVSVDGNQQAITQAVTDFNIYEKAGFVPQSGLEVDSSTEQNKQIYGFVTTIAEESSQKIEVSYKEGQKIDITKPIFTYNGWLFKQPGVESYPYSFSLSYPDSFIPLKKFLTSFNKNFGEDEQFSVEFTHK